MGWRNRHITFCAFAALAAVAVAQPALGATDANPSDRAFTIGTNPHVLYLRTGDVDLTKAPSMLGSDTALPADAHFVIHLDGPITPQRRTDLEQAGVRLGEYLPMYSYICAAPGVKPTDLAKLGFVRWLGDFDADWRIAPDIGTLQFQSDERKAIAATGRVRVWIELLPGASADRTLAKLASLQALVLAIEPVGESIFVAAETPLNKVAELKDVPDILFVEEIDEPQARDHSANWIGQSNVLDSMSIWNAGLTGTGQIVGIIDWSLVATHCSFSDVNPIGPLHRKIVAYLPSVPGAPGSFADHGTTVSSILAGEAPGQGDPNYRGVAYNAKIVFHDMNQGVVGGSGTPDLLRNTLTAAHNAGARLHNNSWGSASVTNYTNWCRDVDLFSRTFEDDIVLFAVNNVSPPPSIQTSTNPDNSKNCLAVSAAGDSPSQDNACLNGGSPIGAQGPTTDGRRKPEVMGVGCGITSANYNSACSLFGNGPATSWATPAAAGLAVLSRQYFIDGYYPTGAPVPANTITPTGALQRAMLCNTSVDLTAIPDYPSLREGWGRVLLDNSLYLAGDARKLFFRDKRNAVGLSTGQSDTVTVSVVGGAQSLKITLVWTDIAAAALSVFTPVNNLDLIVTAPNASVYKGNVFIGGQSATGGAADDRNNVEQVLINTPLTGDYTIQISGTAVNSGLQGYALVVTGDIIPFECGTILKGDVNLDGQVNGRDIGPFVNVMTSFNNVIVSAQGCAADNGGGEDPCSPDGLVDANDLPGFITRLLTGTCP